jgi:release factor glutamine methyltransferase
MSEGHLSWADLVREAQQQLETALGDDRKQEARWIVERVSGYSSTELRMHTDELVSTRAVSFFDALVTRRAAGEPLQYVLGRWQFRTLELIVDRSVLIPRPETEMVAGLAIDIARKQPDATVVDLGTGSGAIALSVAVEVPHANVWATDVSEGALRIARANLAGIGRSATRVNLSHGSWFEALRPELMGTFDVIVSNPPYVASTEELPAEVVDWEPATALFSGPDGTEDLQVLIPTARQWLTPGGYLILEMSPTQTAWAAALANSQGFVDVRVVNDLAGKPRALVASRPSEVA